MNVDLISVLVAVVAVGVGLAGLVLASWRGVRHEMRGMRHEMRGEIHEVRHEMRGMRHEMRGEIHEVRQEMRDMRNHMGRMDAHIGDLRQRVGHVEGLLRGLREVFVPRTAD